MDYSRIVAVTGMPGLYEILSSKSDGAIAKSLEDGSTKFISSRVHNLTHLESIEIYTTGDNVNLSNIFTAMKNNSEALPEVKSNEALKAYFEKVYPEMDFDRVYASDMKKIISWFKVIQQNNIDFTVKSSSEDEEETTEVETVATEAPAEAAPEATAKPKRTRKKKTEEE